MIIIRIGFIGAGKVGFTFGKYFKENNLNVLGYFSRTVDSSYRAANFTKTKQFLKLKDLINMSDIIFITTGDNSIPIVWKEIRELSKCGEVSIDGKIICHCSGSLTSNVFSNISEYNAYPYSIHPLFAISDKFNSYKTLKEAFITIEGHKKYLNYFKSLFENLGNKVQIICGDNKALYHASAVMCSNLVLGIIECSIKNLTKCGFYEDEAKDALYPLISFNIDNIKENSIVESLTGPLERGDLDTIIKHCEVLNRNDQKLYKVLSKEVLGIAKRKNKNRNYENIEMFLGEE
ncbi:Rossmann-like and DUF2520 domain-containing protein [Clostridium sp. B9]|uniref:Rossmann-like and DUF2520 domain-containing protein n=1 Tax=Clostridium sp. B9 TaxID=3423224 RepID=UPI003D2F4AD2